MDVADRIDCRSSPVPSFSISVVDAVVDKDEDLVILSEDSVSGFGCLFFDCLVSSASNEEEFEAAARRRVYNQMAALTDTAKTDDTTNVVVDGDGFVMVKGNIRIVSVMPVFLYVLLLSLISFVIFVVALIDGRL